jgi:hypothetical protein
MDRAIQKLRPVPRLDERFDAGDLTLRVNQCDTLLHGTYLGLADRGGQRMRLPVDVGFGDMVKINEHELAYAAACQRLGSPRAYPANANDGDASLPDARGTTTP